ncbi:MAG: SH3 domain-containing protein [Alphaproteobacteria bacterium]|nr:SH3 domain-containing protein [Alphaproteobacteria bacterium]
MIEFQTRLGIAVAAVWALASPAVDAAPGDLLVIIGNQVNLRQGPGTTQPIVGTLDRGQIVIERERYNEWFHVDLRNNQGNGWIHGTLIAPVSTGLGTGGGKAFWKFRGVLEAENQKVFDATGVYAYTAASDVGDATVTITPTGAWLASVGDLSSHALRLYNQWKVANDGAAVVLVINDPLGNVFVTVQEIDGETLVTTHY